MTYEPPGPEDSSIQGQSTQKPIPAYGLFTPTLGIQSADLSFTVPAFRSWGDRYCLEFEARTSHRYPLLDLRLMAHRDEERLKALDLHILHDDVPQDVMIGGHVTEDECNGVIHVDSPPPSGNVVLVLSWPPNQLDGAVVNVPSEPIREASARIVRPEWS
ncbi:hypothetical protein [Labedaea rhizosphaerae]|uniref:hypothetical protein n=1 Tax=Labedaea rhizosphaerae TaxID=598644 RepID=UPI00105EB25B|nr:hypothetical protein [Labedaea rhizosphaerae]